MTSYIVSIYSKNILQQTEPDLCKDMCNLLFLLHPLAYFLTKYPRHQNLGVSPFQKAWTPLATDANLVVSHRNHEFTLFGD